MVKSSETAYMPSTIILIELEMMLSMPSIRYGTIKEGFICKDIMIQCQAMLQYAVKVKLSLYLTKYHTMKMYVLIN
jgi:hypothetical protein